MMPLGKHMTGVLIIGYVQVNVSLRLLEVLITWLLRSGDGRPGGGRSGSSTLGSGRSDASIEVIDVEKGVASIALPGISNQLPVDVLHTIAMSEKNSGMQALIQYPAVHHECYGVRDKQDFTSWVCRACETPDQKRECCLCPVREDAFFADQGFSEVPIHGSTIGQLVVFQSFPADFRGSDWLK
ncbi:hypothetical protein ABZP36_029303 [Zizania latifolia]